MPLFHEFVHEAVRAKLQEAVNDKEGERNTILRLCTTPPSPVCTCGDVSWMLHLVSHQL